MCIIILFLLCSSLIIDCAASERLQLLLNGSESHEEANGDVSPDLPELDWAEEVCWELEADMRTQSQAHSFMKKSHSLEQLLQACQLNEPLNSVRI